MGHNNTDSLRHSQTHIHVRASAQNLFNLVIVGIGVSVGSPIATYVVGEWAGDDYTKLFSVPLWASIVCFVLLMVFYPGGRRTPGPAAALETP